MEATYEELSSLSEVAPGPNINDSLDEYLKVFDKIFKNLTSLNKEADTYLSTIKLAREFSSIDAKAIVELNKVTQEQAIVAMRIKKDILDSLMSVNTIETERINEAQNDYYDSWVSAIEAVTKTF
jgi:hypothetical protein